MIPPEIWTRRAASAAYSSAEPERRSLHQALIAVIGAEHAGTLMEYLLPAPWHEMHRLGIPIPH